MRIELKKSITRCMLNLSYSIYNLKYAEDGSFTTRSIPIDSSWGLPYFCHRHSGN
jgi:hypothetical protein